MDANEPPTVLIKMKISDLIIIYTKQYHPQHIVQILSTLGIDLDPKKYYSVCDVQRLLQDYEVYTGKMYSPTEYDAAYFARRPIPYPTHKTIYEIYKLIPRLANK